jgi:hypothetical protein
MANVEEKESRNYTVKVLAERQPEGITGSSNRSGGGEQEAEEQRRECSGEGGKNISAGAEGGKFG